MSELALLGGTPVLAEPLRHYPSLGEAEMQSVVDVMRSGILSGFFGSPGPQFFGGPVVAGDTLFGRFVLPQAMTLQAVRATALAGGGTATVLQLFSDGSALSAVTLAAAAADTPQTVAATWSDALTAATALTFVATPGPTDPALGLTGVNVWLRLRPA